MEKIIVCDNFLKPNELGQASDIIKTRGWKFGHESSNFSTDTPFWSMDLVDEPFFTEYLKGIIETYFGKKFKLNRVYANGQTFGQDGSYHIDTDNADCYTFALYLTNIHPDNVEIASGNIYFKFPDVKYKIGFEPLYNRGIFFPSNYMHKATAFSRYILDLRICVAWKLQEII